MNKMIFITYNINFSKRLFQIHKNNESSLNNYKSMFFQRKFNMYKIKIIKGLI